MNITTRARRGGFTLVELLIVIIIIAILAGMMMLTTGSATDRAEATKVINDLRAYKAAALMYYADNQKWPFTGEDVVTAPKNLEKSLSKYIDRSLDKRYTDGVHCRGVAGDNVVIGVRITEFSLGVRKILGDSAKDAGLFMTMGTASNVEYFNERTDNYHIYMRLR